jgi:Zn-finger nucleic acid-binding protein
MAKIRREAVEVEGPQGDYLRLRVLSEGRAPTALRATSVTLGILSILSLFFLLVFHSYLEPGSDEAWRWIWPWAVAVAAVSGGLSLVLAGARYALERSGAWLRPVGTLSIDSKGTVLGRWRLRLIRPLEVWVESRRGHHSVRISTVRCPDGVVFVRDDPDRTRALRVARAVASRLGATFTEHPRAAVLGKAQVSCPACRSPLRSHLTGRVASGLCPRCHRVWIDGAQIEGAAGPSAPAALGQAPSLGATTLLCPRDADRLVNLDLEEILLTRCPTCGGILLDRGQLAALRGQLAARRAANSSEASEFAIDFLIDLIV